jgi:DNA-binding transcriptional MocR family regulator
MAVNNEHERVSILASALQSEEGFKYQLLAMKFAQLIKDGIYAPEEKLPPHRALSYDLGVTPGTVSKAYAELAELGLVISKVGGGTFVRSAREAGGAPNFSVFAEDDKAITDLSRNFAIPTNISDIYRETVEALAHDQETLIELQQYSSELGHPRHREAGAYWMSHGNFQANPMQIVCTNGAQHALLCSLMAMVKHGSIIATERFTYPGLISACRALGITLVGLEMDDEGLDPASLQAVCSQKRISALYCTPTIQNPTNGVMGIERRKEIARICRQNSILLIEDETYACLLEDRLQPIGSLAPELSIIVSSLSKAVMTGLRVGFVHAPEHLIERIGVMVRTTCWMATPTVFQFAGHWIRNGVSAQLTKWQIDETGRRKQLVEPILREHDALSHPKSPHYWIKVPDPWRASEISDQLRDKGCLVAPAEAFSADPVHTGQFIRASMTLVNGDDEQLIRGFQLLSDVLRNPASRSDIY